MSFSSTPSFDELFAKPPHRPFFDWLILVLLLFGLLFLALNLSACGSSREVALPSWGNTPTQQQQPSSALFP